MWDSELDLVCAAALALACAGALAQPAAPAITDADIERARRDAPVVTEADIERARRLHAPVSAKPVPQVAPGAPGAVNVDALPVPATPATVDLGAVARGYAAVGAAGGASALRAQEPALFVFVSLAIPQRTLELLFEQAARARATLVLRGVHDHSLAGTVARVRSLAERHPAAVQIDPQAFSRYGVTVVPAVVVVRANTAQAECARQSCPAEPSAFVGVAGDVSLDYALEHVARHAPEFAAEAATLLARMR